VMPGYDCVIKCSHLFNVLDARGAISVSERVGYIARVRKLARRATAAYAEQRRALGYPLITDAAERERWLARGAEPAAKPAKAPRAEPAAANAQEAVRGA